MGGAASTEPDGGGQIEYGYAPLELENIRSLLPIACDLYIEEGGRHILYRSTQLPFTALDCERLMAAGVTRLWVYAAAGPHSIQDPVTALLGMPDDQVPPKVKAKVLYDSALSITRHASTNPAIQVVIPGVANLVDTTLRFLTQSPKAYAALISVMRHDYSVYTHAVNVGFYAVGVGRSMGIMDERELGILGMGAFLHDVGKSNVPNSLLSKPGALTAEEWTIMRQHPDWGRSALESAKDVPQTVLEIVGQHHERMDGSGYPEGLCNGALNPYAKVVAIVDSFDAMTSNRPYRQGRSPFNALQILKGDLTDKLDVQPFAALVRLLRDLSQGT